LKQTTAGCQRVTTIIAGDKPQTIVIVNKTTIKIRKKQKDREIETNIN